MAMVKPNGIVGLLTPSGIASDKTASKFFSAVATGGRLKALYDFENRGVFFPDVHNSFKFCVFVASPNRKFAATNCSFYLHSVAEMSDPARCFPLSADDFALVNPNTGTAPIFRSRRDAEITARIYRRLPVLVDRSKGGEAKAWPVRYATMFHMTNDSSLFRTREELEEKEGAWRIDGNRWRSAADDWLPLYVGRMINQFDHRAASVVVNEDNLHNVALSDDVPLDQKKNFDFASTPQYWVPASKTDLLGNLTWAVGFRDIARATDVRTVISAIVPRSGFGNKLPLLLPSEAKSAYVNGELLVANFNALILDFVARSKVHSTSVNWFIAEQFPIVPRETYGKTFFGKKTAAQVIRDAVLELTYTSNDMAPFARDMKYVKADGKVKPPFIWDDRRRLTLRAKLDAVYFHLYGITDRDDVRYIYSTFPIVEREETHEWGHYASRELCLAWMNALKAGKPDEKIELPV
jgi:hypothetical protein